MPNVFDQFDKKKEDNIFDRFDVSVKPVITDEKDTSIGEDLLGGAENIMSLISGAVAEPIAGLTGIAAELIPGGKTGTEQIESIRKSMTYEPRTETGKEQQKAIGEALTPVGEFIGDIESGLGERVLDATGSPELAAIAHTLPTAVLELVGIKGMGKIKGKPKKLTKKVLSEASPSKSDLKDFSRSVYKEIDDSGAVLKEQSVRKLSNEIKRDLKSAGYNKRVNPKIRGVIEELTDLEGRNVSVTELDTLRRIAANAAKSIEPAEQMLASKTINRIDDFMDKLTDDQLEFGTGSDLGSKYKDARKSWGKAKKIETVDEIMRKAEFAASGLENGIRQGFTSLLKNKKKLKGFTPDEIKIMENISKGGTIDNILKKVGKLGFGEGKSGSLVGTAIGVGAGTASFGPLGGIVVPFIGQVSRNLSQALTKRKSALLNDVIGAGKDGREIIKAYIKHVPRSKQSAATLSELLLKADISPSDIKKYANISKKMKDDLIYYADIAKRTGQLGVISAPGAMESLEN